ncbi:hypothetical protein [Ornithinimicrobium sp. INDO-MA30-4]|uniref:hypothetical protein n=1 Tax=Ornithinimicrobium sp. INDO-MA30-4 TaxID=2908651 RepID=UPI001F310C7F|nr:hypothetical protein [Ornithinimicrobium sp. INDO-MA30-4]UJH69574.1 hypothetical protein L0A91_09360 [Ornithinimicrobium sp. INDO-MA30-4]
MALARALATDPDLLLLDEPLSALDPDTASTTRADLHHRLSTFSGTTVIVTHDPVDALTLADELVFLEHGRVVQSGRPAAVIAQPRNAFVASIVGLNLLSGTVRVGERVTLRTDDGFEVVTAEDPDQHTDGALMWATIDPVAIALYESPATGSTRNTWGMRVSSISITGQRARIGLAATST